MPTTGDFFLLAIDYRSVPFPAGFAGSTSSPVHAQTAKHGSMFGCGISVSAMRPPRWLHCADATGCCVLSDRSLLASFCRNGATCPVVGTYTAHSHPTKSTLPARRPPPPFILSIYGERKNDRSRPLNCACLHFFYKKKTVHACLSFFLLFFITLFDGSKFHADAAVQGLRTKTLPAAGFICIRSNRNSWDTNTWLHTQEDARVILA